MNNTTFINAKMNKKDEFYTQYADVENELRHYTDNFKDQVVYCNCDNPEFSNFYKFFKDNFHKLGLKGLKATYLAEESYITTYDGENEYKVKLKLDGDFRSPEVRRAVETSDIIVTNPPFSLFREYLGELMFFNKKFLIIGNINAITLKNIFPLIRNKKVWLGYGFKGMVGHFYSPYEDNAVAGDHRDGMIRVSGVVWFTNLKPVERPLYPLTKVYSKTEYPKYDDYDAIEVSKAKDIPMDYKGLMGVPVKFIDKLNYNQFEIVDMITPTLNGVKKYKRLVIRHM